MIITAREMFVAFLVLMVIGLLCGILKNMFSGINYFFKKNIILTNIVDFFHVLLSGGMFFLGIVFYNYGQFRFYLLISFMLGYIIQRKTLSKLIAKISIVGYNILVKYVKSFLSIKLVKKALK